MKVRIGKALVIATLGKNRDQHRRIFFEALAGFKKRAQRELEGMITKLKADELIEPYWGRTIPKDHTRDYDRVIAMVDAAEDEEIEMNETDFAHFMLDRWDWSREWLKTSSQYSESARLIAEEADEEH